jgi:hypothetical protein
MKTSLIPVLLAAGSLAILGCDNKPPANTAKPTGGGTHTHADGTKHDDDHADHDHDDHDAVVSLGKLTASGYEVEALSGGEVKAGNELHVTVKVTGGASKVVAVRVWAGVEDAAGSTKAKADVEEAGWHAHVEVPSPIPAGNKLWVEIENEKHEAVKFSFPFKS